MGQIDLDLVFSVYTLIKCFVYKYFLKKLLWKNLFFFLENQKKSQIYLVYSTYKIKLINLCIHIYFNAKWLSFKMVYTVHQQYGQTYCAKIVCVAPPVDFYFNNSSSVAVCVLLLCVCAENLAFQAKRRKHLLLY